MRSGFGDRPRNVMRKIFSVGRPRIRTGRLRGIQPRAVRPRRACDDKIFNRLARSEAIKNHSQLSSTDSP